MPLRHRLTRRLRERLGLALSLLLPLLAGAQGGSIALSREPGDLPSSRAPAAVVAAGEVLASEGDAET